MNRRIAAGGGLVLAGVALSLGYCVVHLGTWLAAPAQQPERADLIVALGGDSGDRIVRAAQLHRDGMAKIILLTGIDDGAGPTRQYYLEWRAQFLRGEQIPSNAIRYDTKSSNSREEALNTLALMQQEGWKHALVVSDPPHMRRLQGVWGKAFAGSGKTYRLVITAPSWWNERQWWKNDQSAQFVITEVIKLGYYAVAY